MIEFTGERVIPGRVPADLLNEHLGRYAFAEAAVAGKCVLDAGCGVGYGSARLAALADTVYALDNAAEAVRNGHAEYPDVRFIRGDCSRLPFGDNSLDVVAAFEVIEHLEDWEALLREAARVLRPAGTFLVSTPNRIYYEGSRDEPNPFHVHEFDYEEFRGELAKYFLHLTIFFENHANAITFMPEAVEDIRAHIEPTAADPAAAHFFLAACSHSPIYDLPGFAYLPRGGNILRDRERHIEKLENELAQKTRWLKETAAELENLARIHREDQQQAQLAIEALEAENSKKTQWAECLEEELKRAAALLHEAESRVTEQTEWAQGLDAELKRAAALLHEAESRVTERTEWAQGLDAELKRAATLLHEAESRVTEQTEWAQGLDAELKRAATLLHEAESRVTERTEWAQGLDAELKRAATLLHEAESRVTERTEWAQGLDAELKRAATLLHEAESRVTERTEWAHREAAAYRARIEAIRASPAYRAARRLGLAPSIAKTSKD